MATKDEIMVFKKPHFTVKLHSDLLEVDLTHGLKKELEDALEAKPALRETFGFLFQPVIPLDIPLKDIESVTMNKSGQVKIVIPHRKDILIPLSAAESKKLINKMNTLIPIEKAKEIERILVSEKLKTEIRLRLTEAASAAEGMERRGR
jgi:hypothetical protein